MSKVKRSKKVVSKPILKREDIYMGDINCPLCDKPVSAYRVACFLEQVQKHSDFVSKTCPICRK